MTTILAQLPGFLVGALVSGVACVLSSRYLGWFNKQVGSIETKIP